MPAGGKRSHSRPTAPWLLPVGLGYGVAVSLVNTFPPPNVLSLVIGVGWSWAALAVLSGALERSRPALIAGGTLLAAVIGYYATDLARGVYTGFDRTDPVYLTDPSRASLVIDWPSLGFDAGVWGAVALALGPLLGLVGAGTRRGDVVGLLCRLAVPVGVAVEMLALRLAPYLSGPQPRVITVVAMVLLGIGGAAWAAVFCAHYARSRASVGS